MARDGPMFTIEHWCEVLGTRNWHGRSDTNDFRGNRSIRVSSDDLEWLWKAGHDEPSFSGRCSYICSFFHTVWPTATTFGTAIHVRYGAFKGPGISPIANYGVPTSCAPTLWYRMTKFAMLTHMGRSMLLTFIRTPFKGLWPQYCLAHVGSGVVKIDLLHFRAVCHKRQLNQV